MNLEFKVFRITNAVALTISGTSAVLSLSGGLSPDIIVSVLVLGACFIHSILSLSLQRHWIAPEVPLKESTPGGVRIMGGIELIFSFFFILVGGVILMMTHDQLKMLFDQLPDHQKASNMLTPELLKRMGAYTFFMGILFGLNVILSFRLLKKIKRRQEQEFPKEQE